MDMDLIEVLWKQDVDLGFSVENVAPKPEKAEIDFESENSLLHTKTKCFDDLDKLKALQSVGDDDVKAEPQDDDPWAGLNYTVDTETGEYVIKGEDSPEEPESSCELPLEDLSLPLPEFLLDDALTFDDLEDEVSQADAVNLKDIELLSLEADTPSNPDNSTATTSTAPEQSPSDFSSLADTPGKESDDLDFLDEMIQTPQFHHPHHRPAFQSRMPFVRTMSMEQRWQDLANLLSLPSPGDGNTIHHPFSHHHHHPLHNYGHPHPHSMGYTPEAARGVLLHNATLAPPMGDMNSTVPYSNLGGTNLGNAVATSMNLTNSSEPMVESTGGPHYKLEPSHDVYYQNGSSEINQTDGFLSSILNDEDLQLMDMAMNEGMYTMRMLDGNNAMGNLTSGGPTSTTIMSRTDMERMDASSDSAVSSMGSERVPSLSDGEWGDTGSDSGHTSSEHYVTDYHNKLRPYDYSYSSRHLNSGVANPDHSRMPPVAQKKHQMYGKRYFQDHNITGSAQAPQTPMKYEYREGNSSYNMPNNHAETSVNGKMPEMKYSCSMEFGLHNHLSRANIDPIQHNHTYHLPAESSGTMQRPVSRDKAKNKKSEEHLTRDEKRARALNVPITVDDIINLPMDEFNERLSKYDLSEAQLSLIRDIRRRGKNKVAAQNCRKRKLDQILSLADEVKEMRDRKMMLINDHKFATSECKRMKDKYQQLYRHVFQNLRDADGNSYSPYQYSLQASADGTILMVPCSNSNITNVEQKEPPKNHKE